jgi:predicted transcriptional regulator
MIDSRDQKILEYIKLQGACSSKELYDNIDISVSYATVKRILTKLITENYLVSVGQGKGTKYIISPTFELLAPIDIERYYEKEIDERYIKEGFNFSIINEVLANHSVFANAELEYLNELQAKFQHNIYQLTDKQFKKEFERLAIDLSYLSSIKRLYGVILEN